MVLTSTGIDKHSATIFQPETGFGAVYESARVLDEIRSKLSGEQGLTINLGSFWAAPQPRKMYQTGKALPRGEKPQSPE